MLPKKATNTHSWEKGWGGGGVRCNLATAFIAQEECNDLKTGTRKLGGGKGGAWRLATGLQLPNTTTFYGTINPSFRLVGLTHSVDDLLDTQSAFIA